MALRLPSAALRRRLLVPIIVALGPLFWVVEASRRSTLLTLGRDQGIFQYIARAIERGAVDYRDVRDVNGPLIHGLHLLFLRLGGGDERRFRILDLVGNGLAFAAMGACLPGLGGLRSLAPSTSSRPFPDGRREVTLGERGLWAVAAWVAFSSQYFSYVYWDLAQRESFCDWFALTALAAQLVGQGHASSSRGAPRLARAALVLAGALSVLPWFGKPTYVVFTAVQLVTLLMPDEADEASESRRAGGRSLGWRARVALFAAGGCAGAATQLAYLWRYGDVRAFLRIYLVDVPTLYRFIWPKSVSEIFSIPGNTAVASAALVSSSVVLFLLFDGRLPRRALSIALFPLAGLAGVVLQRKGFPYHFHPVTLGYTLQWVAVVVYLSEAAAGPARRASLVKLVPVLAAAALATRLVSDLQGSPHLTDVWILAKGETAELRASRDYLVYFRNRDFFPWEMRQAADYLKRATAPDDRVQVYGMDPYVLFLADRLSATPYIYAYDLDVDAALDGGWSLYPTSVEADRIRALRDEHERDLLDRVRREPPAAFVFIDKAPLMTLGDARRDFAEHCSTTDAWVKARYKPGADFGEYHVLLRDDVAPPTPPAPSTKAPKEDDDATP